MNLKQTLLSASPAAGLVLISAIGLAVQTVPPVSAQNSAAMVVYQDPKNSVDFVDASGRVNPITNPGVPMYDSTYSTAGISGDTIFALANDTMYAIFANILATTTITNGYVSGLAAKPVLINQNPVVAVGVYSPTGEAVQNQIVLTGRYGKDQRSVLQQSIERATVLPVRWSSDGKRLYYSMQLYGMGGYILFGGLFNLNTVDTTSGVTKTVVPASRLGGGCWISDLSPNENLVAYACNDNMIGELSDKRKAKTIGVLNLTSGKATTIRPPTRLREVGVVGGAVFSPDGKRVAFGLARRASNEQGWLAVSNDLSGPATLIVSSRPGEVLTPRAWLDNETIVFQRSSVSRPEEPNSIWIASADGRRIRQLAEGRYLAMLPGSPSTPPAEPTKIVPPPLLPTPTAQ